MAKLNPIERATTVTKAIRAAYERRAEDWRRPHLGASVIGHQCDRFLWMTFRWALAPQHDGQQLRLFERGHREEAWVIEDLRAAGYTIEDRDPATGEQWLVSWGHVGGHLDGIVLLDKTRAVLECKTHSRKSFDRLLEKGLRSAKPEHWAQCQVYMLGMGLQWALYIAVCKDDDRIEALLVPFDKAAAEALVERGLAICRSETVPDKLDSEQPPCCYVSKEVERWPCQFFELCHRSAMPARHCRTCIECKCGGPLDWLSTCGVDGKQRSAEEEKLGCPEHVSIPALLNAQMIEVDEAKRVITYQRPDGSTFVDGGNGVC